MTIKSKEFIYPEDIHSFLDSHKGEKMQVMWDSFKLAYRVEIERDMTEAEFNMEVLRSFAVEHLHGELTMEERNAIDYAIGAIKTLQDMGVIK